MSTRPGQVTADGIVFGPNSSGKTYLSWYAHRGADRGKSRWLDDLPPAEEYTIFCHSDEHNWSDPGGNYWGIRGADGRPLGTRGERIAKFPNNSAPATPWHGYPTLSSGRGGGAPPDSLVTQWIGDRQVTRTFGLKIQRRKV
jgi:hypothetical protein